jgi:hypothetical protein
MRGEKCIFNRVEIREEGRLLGRRSHRWDNIKIDDINMVCVDWIHMSQDSVQLLVLVNMVMHLLVST